MSEKVKIDIGKGLVVTEMRFTESSNDSIAANVDVVLNNAIRLKGYALFANDDGSVRAASPNRAYEKDGKTRRYYFIDAPTFKASDEVSLDFRSQRSDRVCDAIESYWLEKQPALTTFTTRQQASPQKSADEDGLG